MLNPGDEPATVRWLSAPAGRVESYFAAMDRLNRDGKPGLVGPAGLLREYRDVMVPASPLTRTLVRLLSPLDHADHQSRQKSTRE
jgi:hypothetical protein